MRDASRLILLGILALSGPVACGKSDAQDADGGADGAPCATSADCTTDRPYCSAVGQCKAGGQCETDADCGKDMPFCNEVLHTCDLCRTDADCQDPEAPVCAPGWESGLYCAACRAGNSSTCETGTWCVGPTGSQGQGGSCKAVDCEHDPTGNDCSACLNENAGPCLDAGGACSSALARLRSCYMAELPGWTTSDCPTEEVPSLRGCTPAACFDEADALDVCLRGCQVATDACAAR